MDEQAPLNAVVNIFFNVSGATVREYLNSKGKEWEAGTAYESESLFREAMSELKDSEQRQIEEAMSYLRKDESIIFRIIIAIVQDIGIFEKQQNEKGKHRRQQTTNTLQQKGLGAQLLQLLYNSADEKQGQGKQHDMADQIRNDLSFIPQQFVSAIKRNLSSTPTSFEDFRSDSKSSKKVKPPEKIKTEVISRGGGNKSGIGAGVAIVTLVGLGILLVLSGGKKDE